MSEQSTKVNIFSDGTSASYGGTAVQGQQAPYGGGVTTAPPPNYAPTVDSLQSQQQRQQYAYNAYNANNPQGNHGGYPGNQGQDTVVISSDRIYQVQQQRMHNTNLINANDGDQYALRCFQFCCICFLVTIIVVCIAMSNFLPLLLWFMGLLPGAVLLLRYYRPYRHLVDTNTAALMALMGMLSIIPAVLVELGLGYVFAFADHMVILNAFFQAFLVASLVEESTKYITIFFTKRDYRNQHQYSGLVYGLCMSMGFATVENLGYVAQGRGLVGVIMTGVMRAVAAVPMHCLTGMYMGTLIADRNPADTGSRHPFWKIFLPPFLLHGIYDFTLFATAGSGDVGLSFGMLAVNLVLVIIGFVVFEQKIKPQTDEYAGTGTYVQFDPQQQQQQQQQQQVVHPAQPVHAAHPVHQQQYAGPQNV